MTSWCFPPPTFSPSANPTLRGSFDLCFYVPPFNSFPFAASIPHSHSTPRPLPTISLTCQPLGCQLVPSLPFRPLSTAQLLCSHHPARHLFKPRSCCLRLKFYALPLIPQSTPPKVIADAPPRPFPLLFLFCYIFFDNGISARDPRLDN